MDREKFKELVTHALDDLPDAFIQEFDNIEVTIEDAPSKELCAQLELDHHRMLLGLYQGVPLIKRSKTHYSMVLPDKIILFQRNIESVCCSEEEIKKQVRKTVIHEVAHHFGIGEKRLRELERAVPTGNHLSPRVDPARICGGIQESKEKK